MSDTVDFLDEELLWWDEPPARPTPAARPATQPFRRRRPPPRTFAGDLARLRRALAGRVPPAVALGAALGLLVLIGVAYVLLAAGSDPAAVAPRAPAQPANPSAAAASAVPVSPVDPVLRQGDRGVAVRDLQHALAALGFSQTVADGAFGGGTAAAVAAFQGSRGLLADGIVGSSTTAELREAVAEGTNEAAAGAEQGLAAAEASGRLEPEAAERHRTVLAEALDAIRNLPPGRGSTVALVLRDVAAQADVYDGPRALALFGMLSANVAHFADNPVPVPPASMTDEDGVVHRWFAGHGFAYHPLGSFVSLNVLAARGQREETARLAAALAARGVPRGRTTSWEYYFAFGGPERWTSALAQAAGAQAFARAGALLEDESLLERAGQAYRAIPRGLSADLGGGTWVREYSYSDMNVLNAQLQSIVSLAEYAQIAQDAQAQRFVASLSTAARAVIHELDTGCWSRYSLGGAPASLHYHDYHVELLRKLARIEGHAVWSETGARWEGYLSSGGPTAC
jgi:D-glucuronyl C5-epimerase-like protein/putative peptidoglycan binding protein